MPKLISFLAIMILLGLITACGVKKQPITTTELSTFLTEKIETELQIKLTDEQKIKIITLSKASGIMDDGVRSSEESAKFLELKKKIQEEVLTSEQKAKVNWQQ
ncbi:MAG: hypothetical protein ACI8P3_000704 [Saprospiraceae bacterium]|jgi:hypothetical protein